MIGLSLSACVSDIMRGKVKEEDVEKIISGTNSRGNWQEVLKHYRGIYWIDYPNKAESCFWRLHKAGKIEEPRLKNDAHYPVITGGHWVTDVGQIRWND